MRRLSGAGAALALLLAPIPSWGQAVPEWARNRTAAEWNAVVAAKDRLARQYGLSLKAIDAIANAVGVRTKGDPIPEIIRSIGESARQTKELKAQVTALEAQVAALSDPAVAMLKRANVAIDEGRLDDADAILTGLDFLRKAKLGAGLQAWLVVVDARAALAHLQLDYDREVAIRREAAATIELQQRQLVIARWRQLMDAATARRDQGRRFGQVIHLRDAVNIIRNEALPLVPKDQYSEAWASTQIDLGGALDDLRTYDPSVSANEVRDLYLAGLSVLRRDSAPFSWAVAQQGLCILQSGSGKLADLRIGKAACQAALEVVKRDDDPELWGHLKANLASVESEIGLLTKDITELEQARSDISDAIAVVSKDDAPIDWLKNNLSLQDINLSVAMMNGDRALLDRTIAALDQLSTFADEKNAPTLWAYARNLNGNANIYLAQAFGARAAFDRAIEHYRAALTVRRYETLPIQWDESADNLAHAFLLRGEALPNCSDAREALSLFGQLAAREPDGARTRDIATTKALADKVCR